MLNFTAKLAAAAALGIAAMAAVPQVQAQGYDNYHSRSESRYEQGYDGRYDDRRRPAPSYRPRPKPSDGCLAVIRATGVGNIFRGVARLNATLAWRREVQAVYGFRTSFSSAKGQFISCEGTRCTASARPCN